MKLFRIPRRLLVTLCLLFTALVPVAAVAEEVEMNTGMIAPDFSLVDQNGKQQTLGHHRGRWVVLYFYPKNNTPGCIKEACKFRDDFFSLQKLDAVVMGVSIDNKASHKEFAVKYGLPFPLLPDTDGALARSYGALWSLGPFHIARRHTFIIDPKGKIARVYRQVNPGQHSQEVIADLKLLQISAKP